MNPFVLHQLGDCLKTFFVKHLVPPQACFVNNVEAVQQLVLGGATINIVDG